MKTLYLSDLDGTLLNEGAVISAYGEEALRRLIESGLHFSIATARTAGTALSILRNIPFRLPIILMNGALIYDTREKVYVKANIIPTETAAQVLAVLRRHSATCLIYALQGNEVLNIHEADTSVYIREFCEERIVRYNKAFVTVDRLEEAVSPLFTRGERDGDRGGMEAAPYKDDEVSEGIVYFTLLDTEEVLRPISEALAAIPGIAMTMYADIYQKGLWYLELFSEAASKRSGALYLKEAYGFDTLVGFGDNVNDLPLFDACDESYAVDNAVPEAKAKATGIIASNREDGVPKWLLARCEGGL